MYHIHVYVYIGAVVSISLLKSSALPSPQLLFALSSTVLPRRCDVACCGCHSATMPADVVMRMGGAWAALAQSEADFRTRTLEQSVARQSAEAKLAAELLWS